MPDYCTYGFNSRDENKGAAKYWRNIGTQDAFYEANMGLVAVSPTFNLYDLERPIRTAAMQLPPAKFIFSEDGKRIGVALDSTVSHGCIVSGERARRSVLSYGVRLEFHSDVEDSILFPNVTIGRHARVRGAIVDTGVQVPDGAVIGFDLEGDRKRFTVTEKGRVVVTRGDLECAQ